MRDNSPSQNEKAISQRFNVTQIGVLKFGSAPIISRNDQFCADIVRTNKSSFLLNYMAKVSSAAIQCCQFWEKLIIFSNKFYESDKKLATLSE